MMGYSGQQTIVLDDYMSQVPFEDIKTLTGFAPVSYQTKGDVVQVLAKKWVFSSCTEPLDWYVDPYGEWARRVREFGIFVRY